MGITNLLLLALIASSVLYMGSSKTVSSSIDNEPAWNLDGSAGKWSDMLPPALEGGRRKTKRKMRRNRK
jgi:hypothetical protein